MGKTYGIVVDNVHPDISASMSTAHSNEEMIFLGTRTTQKLIDKPYMWQIMRTKFSYIRISGENPRRPLLQPLFVH